MVPPEQITPAVLEIACGKVAEQIQEDFRGGRVVRIDGWVLAETEAKLLALARLSL